MPKRSYRQYCALARALDVVGDRWSLLILRNLLLGPQTWSELRDGLPGVARNLLSERLKQLEADGLLEKAPDARYALTPTGQELEPALFALAAWGERHRMGPPEPDEALRLRYLMTSLRRKLQPSEPATVQLWVEGQPFLARLGPSPSLTQGLGDAQAEWHTTLAELQACLFRGHMPPSDAGRRLLGALGYSSSKR